MNLIFLTFVFPLIGFLLLSFSRGRFSENLSAPDRRRLGRPVGGHRRLRHLAIQRRPA
jgi:hypothetical protein